MAVALPVELIQKIFKMSLPSREEAINRGRLSLLDTPWSLTFVSAQWRAIALSIPSLWSSIVIAIPPNTPSWINYPLRLVEEQIVRSGAHPLHVFFISNETPGYTTERLFERIVQSCDRWETLHLDSPWPLPHFYGRNNDFQLLRDMYIRVKDLRPFVLNAPQLRVARIHDEKPYRSMSLGIYDLTSDNFPLPWAHLTTFESTYRHRGQFEGMLQAQNLVECQIAFDDRIFAPGQPPLAPWVAPAQPIVLPHLKKLTLEAPPIYLDSPILPALEELFIRTDSSHFDHLVRLLQRSQCSLRKFWVKSHPPVEQFLQVLMDNPDIFEIGIVEGTSHRPNGPVDIVSALTLHGPQQPVYATALTRLAIRDVDKDAHLNAVLDMVDSRLHLFHLHGCSRLEAFSLIGTSLLAYKAAYKVRFAQLRAAGLDVEIHSDLTGIEGHSIRSEFRRYI